MAGGRRWASTSRVAWFCRLAPTPRRANAQQIAACLATASRTGSRWNADDPIVRQRIARCYSRAEIMRHLGNRVLTKWLQGDSTGVEASISKLYWSEHHRAVTELAMDILGPESMVPTGRRPLRHYRADDPGAPNSTVLRR